MRVLKWVVDRIHGRAFGEESPLGWMPRYEDIEWKGMKNFTRQDFRRLMAIDRESWKSEILSHEELFEKLYDKLPREFMLMRELLLSSLWRSPGKWERAQEGYLENQYWIGPAQAGLFCPRCVNPRRMPNLNPRRPKNLEYHPPVSPRWPGGFESTV